MVSKPSREFELPSRPGASWSSLSLGIALSVACTMVMVVKASAQDDVSDETEQIDEAPISDYDRLHWAYDDLVRPAVPDHTNPEWARNPIDRFIAAGHDAHGLSPMPQASKRQLLRRLSYGLLGRPPSAEEIKDFDQDLREDAYERLVERLLASPEYGLRWGQHWLDLARFAETDGFEHDKTRAEAWKYRDWVVDAFNSDLPYDDFVRYQLAGDEWKPDDADARIATGFCVAGPDMPDINSSAERRHNLLNEMTGTVGAVFMAMQIGCAQCHDHIFDPISQADFYRMRAIFEPGLTLQKNRSVSTLGPPEKSDYESHLMIRGDWQRKGPELEPGFPRIADRSRQDVETTPLSEATGRRLSFAEWLVDPRHPLTARVISNRIWQHHFGEGICRSPSDFGMMGYLAEQEELLNWLSVELIESGWSLKRLHYLILTSSTYRQSGLVESATADASAIAVKQERDPEAIHLSYFPRLRLEGEAIRDAMLFVAGELNDQTGGPGVRPPLPPELTRTLLNNQWNVTEERASHYRRSIYVFARRNLKYPIFDVFDSPNANATCARRERSTTANQSLLLLNSGLSLELAKIWGGRLLGLELTDQQRIRHAVLVAFGREASAAELDAVQQFFSSSLDAGMDEQAAWTDFCLALFNANEFIYLD